MKRCMKFIIIAVAAILVFVLCSCSEPAEKTVVPDVTAASAPVPEDTQPAPEQSEFTRNLERQASEEAARERENTLASAAERIEDVFGEGYPAMEFVLWLENGPFCILPGEIRDANDAQEMNELLRTRTGETLNVLRDRFFGLLDSPETAAEHNIYFAPDIIREEGPILAFSGDISLTDGGRVMSTYNSVGGRLDEVFTNGLLEEMQNADVFVINNEFAFTDRGSPIPEKEFTFRSNPKNVSILQEIGVDAACLANNHVYDFGEIGLFDTLDTLDNAGIARFGAGRNIEDAARPVYYIVDGMKVAIIGASCIDIRFTRVADSTGPGVLRAREYDAKTLLEIIEKAAESCDYVALMIHWGFENTTVVDAYQRQLAKMCIDAGADAVIGGHPHVLQGAEFYKGKPIIYSLGNYWFSSMYRDTGLLKLMPDREGGAAVQLLPCVTGGGFTSAAQGETARHVAQFYESISFDVNVSDEGFITPKQ